MGEERNHQRVYIKEGIEWSTLDLEPIEAFILSRIEPGMTLDDIFYISGLSKDETYRVVLSLVKKRLIQVDGLIPVEEDLEISQEERTKIDRFYSKLDKMNYYEILNVPFDAPLEVIKKQFYLLSREFHPDRYFKKNIGEYKSRLEEIYRKIREAYEVLSDNVAKEVYRESTSTNIKNTVEESKPAMKNPQEQPKSTLQEKTHPVSSVLNAIAERVKKAKTIFEEGMRYYESGDFSSALRNFKLCVAYDPFNQKYKEMLSKADMQQKKIKIKKIIEIAEVKDEMDETDEAIAMLEEAIQMGCDDPVAYHLLGRLYLKKNVNLQTAKTYCLKAIELNPKNADYYITLGQIYTSAGLIRNAKREFERALAIQPDNHRIKLYLEEIKKIEYGKK